jgi:hypothetical protein
MRQLGLLAMRHLIKSRGCVMRLIICTIAFVGVVGTAFALPPIDVAEGEIRCESPGAVVVNVAGQDYAVNAIARWRYPPIELIWKDADIDQLVTRGLTLCDVEPLTK